MLPFAAIETLTKTGWGWGLNFCQIIASSKNFAETDEAWIGQSYGIQVLGLESQKLLIENSGI